MTILIFNISMIVQMPAMLHENIIIKIICEKFAWSWINLKREEKLMNSISWRSPIAMNGTWLNSIILEWNRTNFESWFTIFDRFFLRFASRLIVFKLHLMSLAKGNIIAHVPNPKITTQFRSIYIATKNMCCKQIAIKYPTGFRASNGSL